MNPNEKTIIREVPVTRFAIAKRIRERASSQALSLASTDSRPHPVTHGSIPKHGRALVAHLLACFIHEKGITIENAYEASVWLEWLEGLDTLAADNESEASPEALCF
jgi:hypothetical protein